MSHEKQSCHQIYLPDLLLQAIEDSATLDLLCIERLLYLLSLSTSTSLWKTSSMESWENYNYYTTNSTQWVEPMNYITAKWGFGFFPPNVVALPGAFNSSSHVPSKSLVIEYAGRADTGSRATEAIVSGVVSALVISLLVVWLYFNRKTCSILSTHKETVNNHKDNSTGDSRASTELNSLLDTKFWGIDEFRNQVFNFFYEAVYSEIEVAEKGLNEAIDSDDIEAITDLVRKMYGLQLYLRSHQDSHNFTEQQENEIMSKMAAIHDTVGSEIRKRAADSKNPMSRTV
ncbi:hypothetical protein GGR57DRAFT_506538 [Xylariaceae sp. FL1272]|nr:hypothetical protein GGR57DRAFT_506538 [Xylariaceae sp. FL1272]